MVVWIRRKDFIERAAQEQLKTGNYDKTWADLWMYCKHYSKGAPKLGAKQEAFVRHRIAKRVLEIKRWNRE